MICIRELKNFVSNKYPDDSTLYKIIMTEKDYLTKEEYLAKASIWLRLGGSKR